MMPSIVLQISATLSVLNTSTKINTATINLDRLNIYQHWKWPKTFDFKPQVRLSFWALPNLLSWKYDQGILHVELTHFNFHHDSWSRMFVAKEMSLFEVVRAFMTLLRLNPISTNWLILSSDGGVLSGCILPAKQNTEATVAVPYVIVFYKDGFHEEFTNLQSCLCLNFTQRAWHFYVLPAFCCWFLRTKWTFCLFLTFLSPNRPPKNPFWKF